MRTIPVWLSGAALCGVVLCCATPALAQSVDALQDATGAVIDGSSSSTSPAISATVKADVASSGNSGLAHGSHSAVEPGMASGAAAPSATVGRYGRRPEALGREARGEKGRSAANRVSELSAFRAVSAAYGPRAAQAAKSRATLTSGLSGGKPGSVTESARYSSGFQDSTRGSALISPPDPGTDGPFGFSPGLGAGFTDMATRQFLSPSLHVGRRSGKKGQGGRRAAASAQAPATILPGSQLPTSLSDDLGQSGLDSGSLDTSLSTSIDQP